MASTLQKDQQLRFRWNDHIHHLSKLLVSQRVEEQFCDATIISEDGYVLKGHQAVLSTTSGYFHDVLKDVTSDQHPIIVLNGINYMEFSCLMEYIYQGFTQVDQQFIESVLDAADILEVKGLSKMKSNPSLKKLIRTTDTQSPIATPQYFYPSPSPHYSSSPPANSSPLHICPSSTKIDNLQEDETIDADVQQEGSNDENVMNEKNAHKSIVNYGECDTSETVNSSDNNYSDQTSGIDLSISRSCVKDSTHFLPVDEEVSKKRKLIKLDDNVNNTLSDPDWGRISEKNDNLCPPKRKKFVKKVTLPKDHVPPHQTSKTAMLSPFTLEKLAFLLSKQKSNLTNSNDADQRTIQGEKHSCGSSTQNIKCAEEADPHVEVFCSDGALTISVTTHPDSEMGDDDQSSAQVSLSLRKGKRRSRTRKEIEEKRKKWLAKERSLLFSDTEKEPRKKSLRKIDCVTNNSTSDEISAVNKEKSSLDHPTNGNSEKQNSPISIKENNSDLTPKKSKVQEKKLQFPAISPLSLFTLPPMKEREKQTRTTLTLEEKIKVIKAFLDGKSQRQIAHLYGIGKTQVNCIIKKRQEILSLYRDNIVRGEKLTMKRQRKSEYAALNEHLIQWYKHMTFAVGMKITTGMLRAKALQIAPQLGYHDFKASNGWLAAFKSNNNLKFSKTKKGSFSNEVEQEEDEEQPQGEEDEYFEEQDGEDMATAAPGTSGTQSNPGSSEVSANNSDGGTSSGAQLLHSRTGGAAAEHHVNVGLGQGTNSNIPPVTNHPAAAGAALLSSGPLGKVPQVSNMAIGTNLAAAYNLTRDHSRTAADIGPRADIGHLSDLHSSSGAVNPGGGLPHPPLSKTDGPLSYKSEDSGISYGYDPQSRMNEGSTRASEYNYAHYSFPSTYYGYHFLGQY